jgi:RluA family pseudouridine synthase
VCFIPQVVDEIIGTGGVLSSIGISETKVGYLTPEEFHDELLRYNDGESDGGDGNSDVSIVDCRNTKECKIGTFVNSIDPGTKTFNEFPKWVDENVTDGGALWNKKKIFMFCTGGIRCEKGTAYVRNRIMANNERSCGKINTEVYHLKGGIHKYLELYGDSGLFKGKNFVFDTRQGVSEDGKSNTTSSCIIGKCNYCKDPYDTFKSDCVCTVCREQILVCDECTSLYNEYHCDDHISLKECYFTNLNVFNDDQLKEHINGLNFELEAIAVGKAFKSRRRTCLKQIQKITDLLTSRADGCEVVSTNKICRSCGKDTDVCHGTCWGYFGVNRRDALSNNSTSSSVDNSSTSTTATATTNTTTTDVKLNVSKKLQKKQKQKGDIAKAEKAAAAIKEIVDNKLNSPLSAYRCSSNSAVRIPPVFERVLSCDVKAKWIGKPLRTVIINEFVACSEDEGNLKAIESGVITVNGELTTKDYKLRPGDSIERRVCWHEPPIYASSDTLSVSKQTIPNNGSQEDGQPPLSVYCVNKPSTIPTHPAGQYLANSLTLMVEAQLDLPPNSISPLHRLDKCTSGLIVMADDAKARTIMQQRIEGGFVRKTYIACVLGDFSKVAATEPDGKVKLDAPVWRRNPLDGFSLVDARGKESLSYFKHVQYIPETNRSLILCYPKTGRGHQLRCHLQHLGHSIVDDLMYDGCDGNGGGAIPDIPVDAVIGLCEEVSSGTTKTKCADCVYCRDGFREGFNDTQLLQGGSAICLHAWKYEIDCEKAVDGGEVVVEVVKFEAPVPDFAKDYAHLLE